MTAKTITAFQTLDGKVHAANVAVVQNHSDLLRQTFADDVIVLDCGATATGNPTSSAVTCADCLADDATDKRVCDVCEEEKDILDGGYIVVREGGDVPEWVVCAECLFSDEFTDKYTLATDNAVIGVGHDCLLNAEVRGSEGLWECAMCNVVLEESGDALVLPD